MKGVEKKRNTMEVLSPWQRRYDHVLISAVVNLFISERILAIRYA